MTHFLSTQQGAAPGSADSNLPGLLSYEQQAEIMATRRSRSRASRVVPAARRAILKSLSDLGKASLVEKFGLETFQDPLYLFSRKGTGIRNTEKAYIKHWKGLIICSEEIFIDFNRFFRN